MITLDEFIRDIKKLIGWAKRRKGQKKEHPRMGKIGKWFKRELYK